MKYLQLLILSILSNIAFAKETTIYHNKSQHENIYIERYNKLQCLKFKRPSGSIVNRQGCIYTDSTEMVFSYTKALMSTLLVVENPKRILVIGLGVGTIPIAIRQVAPDALVDVVELDQKVIEIARKYFNWPSNDKLLKIHINDGRKFVQESIQKNIKYDIIILDAFSSKYIPDHLMTYDFLEEVKEIMNPNAVLGANTFADSELYEHESATYQLAFNGYYEILRYEDSGNRLIIAKNGALPDIKWIRNNAKQYANLFKSKYGINVYSVIANLQIKKNWNNPVRVITDQFSPSKILEENNKFKSIS